MVIVEIPILFWFTIILLKLVFGGELGNNGRSGFGVGGRRDIVWCPFFGTRAILCTA